MFFVRSSEIWAAHFSFKWEVIKELFYINKNDYLKERIVFMRKLIKVLGSVLLITSIMLSSVVFAKGDIKVAIDGKQVEFDVKPQLINSRTMVPLRAIFEALGAEVDWENDTQTIVATKDGVTIVSTIGNTKMYVDDIEKTMDVAPMLVDGRTLVPVRFVAEAFECEVFWSDSDYAVYIKTSNAIEDKNNNVGQE